MLTSSLAFGRVAVQRTGRETGDGLRMGLSVRVRVYEDESGSRRVCPFRRGAWRSAYRSGCELQTPVDEAGFVGHRVSVLHVQQKVTIGRRSQERVRGRTELQCPRKPGYRGRCGMPASSRPAMEGVDEVRLQSGLGLR